METQFDVCRSSVVIRTYRSYAGARRYVMQYGTANETWEIGESIPREYYGGGKILKLWEFNPISRRMVRRQSF